MSFPEYVKMIELKTSVLIAASLQLGAILGGAGEGNQQNLYQFGKNLGIAFQVQDDYLDAFGDPEKFGKQPGGDIIVNKKTFLMIHAMDVASPAQKEALAELMKDVPVEEVDKLNKVNKVLQIFKDCKVGEWAEELKDKYYKEAMKHLDEIAVLSSRKTELEVLAKYLLQRDK